MCDDHGGLSMCALDHRGSLQKMLGEGMSREASYQDIVDFKVDACEALSPHCGAMLLDPLYGAAQAIASNTLDGNAGLIVSLEETGYGGEAEGRVSRELEGWSAEKIRRMGAVGAKLLLYYRPDVPVAAQQLDLVRHLAAECDAADLVFVVEPVGYPIGDEASSGAYSRNKANLVVKTAEQLTPLGMDVLKAEFPADLKVEKNEAVMLDHCKRLNEASEVPWIILSAGVGFEAFKLEVQIACQAGASGFLGGRALWQEATSIASRERRKEFFQTTVVDRLGVLTALTNAYGTPWYKKVSAPVVNEGWYATY